MSAHEQSDLVAALGAVPDPRRQCKNLRHRLVDVLVLGFCGVLCGCEDFVEIEAFARSKEAFFRRFLNCPTASPRTTPSGGSSRPSALRPCKIA